MFQVSFITSHKNPNHHDQSVFDNYREAQTFAVGKRDDGARYVYLYAWTDQFAWQFCNAYTSD